MHKERKDVVLRPPCGGVKVKSTTDTLEEELKRHLNGVIASMVKWSKTIEKQHKQLESKHNDQRPQDQAAAVNSTSLDKSE